MEFTDTDVWAVVTTARRQLIGRIVDPTPDYNRIRVSADPNDWLSLSPAFEFFNVRMPISTPQGHMAIQNLNEGLPIGLCTQDATIHVEAVEIQLFSEMGAEDAKRYKALVESAIKQQEAAHMREAASRANIVMAKDVPRVDPSRLRG